MSAKFSEFVPPLGVFIRMPVGAFVFYPVGEFSDSASILSYANRAGGKITTSAVAGVETRSCEVTKLLRCEVVESAPDRLTPGRKANDEEVSRPGTLDCP